MTVKEAVENTVCKLHNVLICQRVSHEFDDTTVEGFNKNRKLIRLFWKSEKNDEQCPPLQDWLANAEIEDNIGITPITGDYIITIPSSVCTQ